MFPMWIAICILLMITAFLYQLTRYYIERTETESDKVRKGLEFYDILARWVELRQKNISFGSYFCDNGYHSVAIYGLREIGSFLYQELKRENVNVLYAIDKNSDEIETEIPVLRPDDYLPETDVIIVTATHYFDQIYLELRKTTKAEIISVEDVLWSISCS